MSIKTFKTMAAVPRGRAPTGANNLLALGLVGFAASIFAYCALAIGKNDITDEELQKYKILKKQKSKFWLSIKDEAFK